MLMVGILSSYFRHAQCSAEDPRLRTKEKGLFFLAREYYISNMRAIFLFTFLLSLSANVYTQINYDSIAIELGYLLEENFTYDEASLFEEKFNDEAFKAYITIKDPDGNKDIEQFNKSFLSEDIGPEIYNRIQGFLNSETSYTFVNYTIDELKNIYIIFRLYSETGGLNYHQYLFEPSGIGAYRITDIYFFLNGEYISSTMETHYYNAIEGIVATEEGVESSELKSLFALARIRRLIDGGNIKKARKIFFRDLSEEDRKKKDYIFLELELTDPNDEAAYKDITERMVNFAEDGNPSFYLSAMDFYYLNKEYDKVITAVDSLYSFTGDYFLEIFKGTAYMELKDFESAEASLIKANDYAPEMATTYDLLFYFYDQIDDTPKFLNVLDTMSKYLKVDYKFLEKTMPVEYPQIVSKDTYTDWIDTRMKVRTMKADSLSEILMGKWVFQRSEDYQGNEIETSEYWEGDYGNTRPDITFSEGGNFSSRFDQEIHAEGTWDFDFNHSTFDFYVPFDKKSMEGKDIIESGFYEVVEGEYIELYSLYYYSIEEEYLKLFDPQNGLNVYKKLK